MGVFMFLILQIGTIFLVSVAMSMALAHALELPGKMRLDRETYIAVQSIYYPGFTIGGFFGEGLGMAATLVLLLMIPTNRVAFWWTVTGLVALMSVHTVFWIVTQPTNKFWLKEQNLRGLGKAFFSVNPVKQGDVAGERTEDWTRLRDRWEYSHLLRAVPSVVAPIVLLVAVTIR
jgi:hypothetical protein